MAHCRASSDFVVVGARSKLYVFNSSQEVAHVLDLEELVNQVSPQAKGSCPSSADKQVLGCAFSPSGSLCCVLTWAKLAFVFECRNGWIQHGASPIRLPKAPTAVTFDNDEKHVIVSDRAGNVNRFELEKKEYAEGTKWQDINGEEQDMPLDPLLGHISIILDMCLSPDGKFLLTGDRDEKLRIARYPQSYSISHFCLGHSSYVKSIQVLDNLVFTSGGDSTIRVWDLLSGETVAVSDRLDELAVRFIRAFRAPQENTITISVAFEKCGTIKSLKYDVESKTFGDITSKKIQEDSIFDLAYAPDGTLFVLTTSTFGLVSDSGEFSPIAAPDDFAESLKESADPLGKLEKVVAFNNMDEYLERKEQRIRKRKHAGDEAAEVASECPDLL
uniref:tRNA (guanine-N(7)-)-methyltransferase non-catalytic subunit n=1 Tax=Steinernema glaseri TaxID=37863 RepID=A0A1I7ZSX9_9BILA